MRKSLFPLFLSLCLALLPFAAQCEEQNDPVVVKVGALAYRLSEVQGYWDSIASLAAVSGVEMNQSDEAEYRQAIIDSYVAMGVMENKYIAFGLDQLSAEEEEALELEAQRLYEEATAVYVEKIVEQYNCTEEEAAEHAATFMALDRYTLDTARDQALRTLKERRMLNYVSADLPAPTQDEVADFYNENFVRPSQDAYENNIKTFENDVLYLGGECYYIPQGYRYVRHLFLPANEDMKQRASELQSKLSNAEAALEKADNKVYGYHLLEMDAIAAEQEQKTAKEEYERLFTALQSVYEEALALHKDALDDIQTRLSGGEAFEIVMKAYSKDDAMPEEGFMISAQSVLWEKNFIMGAMSLEKPGDVSQPIITPAGVHIIEYYSNAPSGPVPLEGELLQTVTNILLREKKYNALNQYIEAWKADYEITTSPELLVAPTK